MKTLNYSRQREAIYNYLLSTKTHPTAEAVYQVVQQDYPKISLATVYRNLALLEETGQVQRIPCNDAKDHYDANIMEHPHFVCNSCNCVLDSCIPLQIKGLKGKLSRVRLFFLENAQNV